MLIKFFLLQIERRFGRNVDNMQSTGVVSAIDKGSAKQKLCPKTKMQKFVKRKKKSMFWAEAKWPEG